MFNCNNESSILCALFIKPCASFATSNNVIWYITSHITCQSKNVIYFLRCTSCDYITTYIGKTVYFHEWITIWLVIDLETPPTNLTTTYLLYAEPETGTFFSNTNVYEISQRTEFTALWKTLKKLWCSINRNQIL